MEVAAAAAPQTSPSPSTPTSTSSSPQRHSHWSSTAVTSQSAQPLHASPHKPILTQWQNENVHSVHTADTQDEFELKLKPQAALDSQRTRSPLSSTEDQMVQNDKGDARSPPSEVAMSASDLADHVQNLSLDDALGNSGTPRAPAHKASPGAVVGGHIETALSGVDQEIEAIRKTLFQLEERRHAETSTSSPSASSKVPGQDAEISASLEARAYKEELQAGIISIDEGLEKISAQMIQIDAAMQANRAEETTSVDSDSDSDSDAGFSLPGLTLGRPKGSKEKRYEAVVQSWERVQQDVQTFKKELADDRYISHFHSASAQAEGLMDSLEKALGICRSFASDYHAEEAKHRAPILSESGSAEGSIEAEDEEERRVGQLTKLAAVKKAFQTKRSYYTPACEQTFAAFERSLKERATSHGMLLRRFSELHNRWRTLKEGSAKMDKELRRIEAAIHRSRNAAALTEQDIGSTTADSSYEWPATPSKYSRQLGGNGPSPVLPSRSDRRVVADSRRQMQSQSGSVGAATSPPPPPPKPLKSPRRIVSGDTSSGLPSSSSVTSLSSGRSPALATPQRHNRSFSASLSPNFQGSNGRGSMSTRNASLAPGTPSTAGHRSSPLGQSGRNGNERGIQGSPSMLGLSLPTASSPLGAAGGSSNSPRTRTPHTLTSKPPTSFRYRSVADESAAAEANARVRNAGMTSSSSVQSGLSRFTRGSSEPPTTAADTRPPRPASVLDRPSTLATRGGTGVQSRNATSQMVDGDESMEYLSGPGIGSRPASSASYYRNAYPSHYRPPSVATNHVDGDSKAARRGSRIPMFAFPPSSASSATSDAAHSHYQARPGSALSQTSSVAGGYHRGGPSRSSYGGYAGASRLTMQTPEPMIAARVQRLSVYAKPSSGAPSSSSMMTTAGGRRGSALSGSRPPTTRSNPRNIAAGVLASSSSAGSGSGSRTTSGATSSGRMLSSGRTTPLSASALAKVPHARPISMSFAAAGAAAGAGGSSFGDRASEVGHHGGRVSPQHSFRSQHQSGPTGYHYPASNASSSVANFRATRGGGTGGSGAGSRPLSVLSNSVRDGAATPTFSEGGMSSSFHSGFEPGPGPGPDGGRSTTSSYQYRPNPNDALDVEVSTITNGLGVPLTRVDPHLPRGAKTETGPGKEVRCRYSFGGGGAMTCKLLELHRPAGVGMGMGMGTAVKQRKVLVKVPGKGFMDLELWLLSTFD